MTDGSSMVRTFFTCMALVVGIGCATSTTSESFGSTGQAIKPNAQKQKQIKLFDIVGNRNFHRTSSLILEMGPVIKVYSRTGDQLFQIDLENGLYPKAVFLSDDYLVFYDFTTIRTSLLKNEFDAVVVNLKNFESSRFNVFEFGVPIQLRNRSLVVAAWSTFHDETVRSSNVTCKTVDLETRAVIETRVIKSSRFSMGLWELISSPNVCNDILFSYQADNSLLSFSYAYESHF